MTVLNKTVVDRIESLPALPVIAQRVLTIIKSPDSSAQDVARALREDPTIAVKILRVANSPFYGAARQITQLSRAITRIGTMAVGNLVLGLCAHKVLAQNAFELPEHTKLWHHSVAVASACELIGRQVGFRPAEEAFVAGLLHDTGQLAILMLKPKLFRSLMIKSTAETYYLKLEREVLGIDHAEAGARILRRWGLPESLCLAVQRHHDSEIKLAKHWDQLVAVVILGDVFAHVVGLGLDRPVGSSMCFADIAQQLQLQDTGQQHVLVNLEQRVTEAVEMLGESNIGKSIPPRPDHMPNVVWIVSEGPPSHWSISRSLLTQRGYEVRCISPAELNGNVPPDDLMIIDLVPSEEDTVDKVSTKLTSGGYRSIVLLHEPEEGIPTRQRDNETGVCRIPRLFTEFDINWIESQSQQ